MPDLEGPQLPDLELLKDQDLVDLARSNADERARAAETLLYQRHFDDTVNIIAARTRSRHLAEDSVTDAFVLILSQIREGQGPRSNFKAYLRTASYSRAVDQIRRDARNINVPEERLSELSDSETAMQRDAGGAATGAGPRGLGSGLGDRIADGPNPERMHEQAAAVAQALAELPENSAYLLQRRYVEHQKPRDIAASTGQSVGTLRVTLHRAKVTLQQEYLRQLVLVRSVGNCLPHVEEMLEKCMPRHRRGARVGGAKQRRAFAHVETCTDCKRTIDEVRHQRARLSGKQVAAGLELLTGGLGGAINWNSDDVTPAPFSLDKGTVAEPHRAATQSAGKSFAAFSPRVKAAFSVLVLGGIGFAGGAVLLGDDQGVLEARQDPQIVFAGSQRGDCDLTVGVDDGALELIATAKRPGCMLDYERLGGPAQPATQVKGRMIVRTAIPGTYEIAIRGDSGVRYRTVRLPAAE